MQIALIILAAYLLGSISNAVWIGKKFFGTDVREHGSKNAGATNTLRVLGRKAAFPVFALDVLKGFGAVMLAHFSGLESGSGFLFTLKIILVIAVVLGHIFPVFYGFRGGKGVATLVGAVLAVNPAAVLLSLSVFIVVLAISHYVSLGSMSGGLMFPVFVIFVLHETYVPMIIFSCIVTVSLMITHRKNIGRLIKGTESKIYLW